MFHLAVRSQAKQIYVLTPRRSMGPRTASRAWPVSGQRVPRDSVFQPRATLRHCVSFERVLVFFIMTLEFLSASSSHAGRPWRICSGSTKQTSTWTWVVDDSLWRRSLRRFLLKNTVKKSHEVFVYGGSN